MNSELQDTQPSMTVEEVRGSLDLTDNGAIKNSMNNTATNSTPCPTVRKQIGKTTYIVRVHFSQTAKETMEDKIKRLLREEVRKM